MKSCESCRFCVIEDYGYSNYTVEGSSASCALRVHPDMPIEKGVEDSRLDFAETCTRFVDGCPVYMDVDHENFAVLTPEDREVWDMHEAAYGR